MGKINIIIISLIFILLGINFGILDENRSSLEESINQSYYNLEKESIGSYALNYGIHKLVQGSVLMLEEEKTIATPNFTLNNAYIDSLKYVPLVDDTVRVISYFRNKQVDIAVAHRAEAVIDFSIKQPDDQFSYYTMEEGSGSILTDNSGKGYDGSLENMDDSNWHNGINRKSLYFDGNEDWVDLGEEIAMEYDDMLTVGSWVQLVPNSPVEWGNIITENSDNLGNQLTGFTLRVRGKLVGHPYVEFEFEVTTLEGKEKVYLKIYAWQMYLLDWHYIAGILNMEEQIIMVGVVDQNLWATAPINASGLPTKNSGVISIGHIAGAPNGQGKKSGITGKISSLRTISDALTIEKLQQLMLYDGVKETEIISWSI